MTTPDRARRRAIIDIGTNSVRLLVAGRTPAGVDVQWRALRQPRLGQDVERRGRLAPDAVERTVAALASLLAEARDAGAASVVALGTSALRDAADRDAFVARVRRELGLPVVVLRGEEEAELAFYGAVGGLPKAVSGDVLYVLDVGGGSTELVYGTSAGLMEGRVSADVGAVRMTEGCLFSDPPSAADRRRLEDAVTRGLAPMRRVLAASRKGPKAARHGAEGPTPEPIVVAVGGTATTLAAVDLGLSRYDPEQVHGHAVDKKALAKWLGFMAGASAAERRALPGLAPERADIIVAGTYILHRVADMLDADGFIASEADLLLGALLKGVAGAAPL